MGISPVDFYVSMNRYPRRGRKIDGLPGRSLITGGGPVPNALCTFAAMGGTASLITSFGDDHWADFLRADLDRFGVRHDLCVVRSHCSSALAYAWIDIRDGTRTIVLDMNPRLDIRARDITLRGLPRPKLVLVDGRHMEADVKLARWAKRSGARIMLDIGSARNPVDDLFPHLDYLVCADAYAGPYFHTRSIEKAARDFRKLGIPEVVVTAGKRGAVGIDADGHEIREGAFTVTPVDVTGAGDTYHGAFLYGILMGWDLRTRMTFAAAAAALTCRRPGARPGIPSRRQTMAFMRRHRHEHV